MITPFKAALGPLYRQIEARLQEAVHIRFGLPAELPPGIIHSIKRADRMAAFIEATQIAGFADAEAKKLFSKPRGTPADYKIIPLPPEKAAKAFLRRFDLLFGHKGYRGQDKRFDEAHRIGYETRTSFSAFSRISHGGMVKLVNTTDLKSVGLIGLPGSSPGVPTTLISIYQYFT